MLLQLEAEGKLTIDDRLGRWLPQYPAWKDVTIRTLLDMTTRIPTYDDSSYFLRAMGSGPDTHWTPAQLVAIVYPAVGPAPPRGPGWVYSNTNYIMAQMIVEQATGDSYANEIARRLLGPLGLRATYYSPSRYPPPVMSRLVAGYYFNADPELRPMASLIGQNVSALNLSWAQGAGGIVSTMDDLTKWVRVLYEGDVLAPAQRRELLRIVSTSTGAPIPTTTLRDGRGFGLGVAQLTTKATGTLWFYEGETLGYRAIYAYVPTTGTIIAVGLNSQPTDDHIGQLVAAIYIVLHRAHLA
jgi:D-alanyl-D-alanine carboxypeptidase